MQHDNASADAVGGPNEKILEDDQHEAAGTQPVKLLTVASQQDPDRAPVCVAFFMYTDTSSQVYGRIFKSGPSS
jgi:hypothetical protein